MKFVIVGRAVEEEIFVSRFRGSEDLAHPNGFRVCFANWIAWPADWTEKQT